LIFALCEIQNIEIVIINKGAPPSFEEELAQDVIENHHGYLARVSMVAGVTRPSAC
jgi:predicted site-specific integrase-resolvase